MHPSPQQFTPVYAAPIHHQQHHTLVNPLQYSVSPQPYLSPSVTQQPQAEFLQLDSGLAVLTNQVTIQDGRVIILQVQGRHTQSFAGTGNRVTATNSMVTNAAGQPRVVKCYNCKREGHMARQYIQPKRPRNFAWFKEKLMLAEAREAGETLDEEQLAFLVDPGIEEAQVAQQIIPQNAAF
ncbi:retrovirus-related pol polyprotein from transposon TNT 1-94 [Tanacetum coccineum]